jgi:aminoglycoside/choline kinase family phosphotransferase
MDAPPDRENTAVYARTARQLSRIGLNVPEVMNHDEERGFMLLSDLGRTTYLERLDEETVDRLYGDALDALIILQTGTTLDPDFFPSYDRALLESEMALFPEWYIGSHIGRELDGRQANVIAETFSLLCRSALEQPKVWVHRDYHSRNLMVTDLNNPGILDFQDAVTGPVTYDLVSLLRDCYIEWPAERVRNWALSYRQLAIRSGLPLDSNESRFMKWFDLMGLQRHIKVLGIFARLYHRDGKSDYLGDLPLVWKYAVDVCRRYEELQPFAELLSTLRPASCTP